MKKIVRTFNNQRYVLVSQRDFYRLLSTMAGYADATELTPYVTWLESSKWSALVTTKHIEVLLGAEPTVIVAASDWVQ